MSEHIYIDLSETVSIVSDVDEYESRDWACISIKILLGLICLGLVGIVVFILVTEIQSS